MAWTLGAHFTQLSFYLINQLNKSIQIVPVKLSSHILTFTDSGRFRQYLEHIYSYIHEDDFMGVLSPHIKYIKK